MPSTSTPSSSPTSAPEPCIPSGDQTAIQSALVDPGDVAVLCSGSVFDLNDTIRFTASDQQIYTLGFPEDESRALLNVAHASVDTAVSAESFDRVKLRNVEIDGNRDEFGFGFGGLIEFGGASSGQIVEHVRAYEPRGWSILVLNEGHDQLCTDAIARNNHFGPGGHAEYGIADGISLACRDSIVENNLIVDMTDGGIVVFQAPGSQVLNNVIRAEERILFYGISMVDYGPFDGDFRGTVIEGNTIDAAGALIRHGIPMGPYNGCVPAEETTERSRGAVVRNNTLMGEHMGFGFMVSGVEDWTVEGNVDLSTREPYLEAGDCFDDPTNVPGSFQYRPSTTEATLQSEFEAATFAFATEYWPLHTVANVPCLEGLIGEFAMAKIRSGDAGTPWLAIEEAPGGRKLERCIDRFVPPVVPSDGPEIQVGLSPCEPRCIEVGFINLSDSQVADLTESLFLIENFSVECLGIPDFLAPLESANCTFSDYVTEGFQVVNWYGLGPAPGTGGWGLTYPDEGI